MIRMYFAFRPMWRVEPRPVERNQCGVFFSVEDLYGNGSRCPMNPAPSCLTAPPLGSPPNVIDIDERFTFPKPLPHISDGVFDNRLVLGMSRTCGVRQKAAVLG